MLDLLLTYEGVQDPDCSVCYCGWCGQSNDLLSCKSCTTLFCTTCVKRNIGEECLSKAQTYGWQCCSCCPSLLQTLTLQFEEAMGSGDLIVSSSDSDSDDSDADMDVSIRYIHIIVMMSNSIITLLFECLSSSPSSLSLSQSLSRSDRVPFVLSVPCSRDALRITSQEIMYKLLPRHVASELTAYNFRI